MIDVSCERLLSPRQVAKLPVFMRNGRPCGISTVYRWFKRGVVILVNGRNVRIRLECVRLPTGTSSSQEAVERFIKALNNQGTSTAAPSASAATHTQLTPTTAKALAAAQLDALGL